MRSHFYLVWLGLFLSFRTTVLAGESARDVTPAAATFEGTAASEDGKYHHDGGATEEAEHGTAQTEGVSHQLGHTKDVVLEVLHELRTHVAGFYAGLRQTQEDIERIRQQVNCMGSEQEKMVERTATRLNTIDGQISQLLTQQNTSLNEMNKLQNETSQLEQAVVNPQTEDSNQTGELQAYLAEQLSDQAQVLSGVQKRVNTLGWTVDRIVSSTPDIRLMGADAFSGRVEVFHKGVWGTVCEGGPGSLSVKDHRCTTFGSVVCKQLHGASYTGVCRPNYPHPSAGPVWLNHVECQGNETTIRSCQHDEWGKHNCKPHLSVGVTCYRRLPRFAR